MNVFFPSSALGLICCAAADRRLRNQSVEGFERTHPLRQEVPRLEPGGQTTGAVSLHHIHHGYEDGHSQERSPNTGHHPPARQREAEHQRGQEQKAKEEVKDSEPAVLGGALAQDTSHPDWETQEGKRIPEQNAKDVEEEMAQSDLYTTTARKHKINGENDDSNMLHMACKVISMCAIIQETFVWLVMSYEDGQNSNHVC